MSAQTEPTSITAGDSVAWQVSLADYPATAGWVLHYRVINTDYAVDIVATVAGDAHAVDLPAATTAAWPAGRYSITRYVVNGTQRKTLSTGNITILPNLVAAQMHDGRSQAEQILDALTTHYQKYVETGKGHWGEYEVAGRKIQFRNSADIIRQMDYWRGQVARERLRAGGPRRLLVRFGR